MTQRRSKRRDLVIKEEEYTQTQTHKGEDEQWNAQHHTDRILLLVSMERWNQPRTVRWAVLWIELNRVSGEMRIDDVVSIAIPFAIAKI